MKMKMKIWMLMKMRRMITIETKTNTELEMAINVILMMKSEYGNTIASKLPRKGRSERMQQSPRSFNMLDVIPSSAHGLCQVRRWPWDMCAGKDMAAGRPKGWCYVVSHALTPDQITELWEVVADDAAHDAYWQPAPRLRVRPKNRAT